MLPRTTQSFNCSHNGQSICHIAENLSCAVYTCSSAETVSVIGLRAYMYRKYLARVPLHFVLRLITKSANDLKSCHLMQIIIIWVKNLVFRDSLKPSTHQSTDEKWHIALNHRNTANEILTLLYYTQSYWVQCSAILFIWIHLGSTCWLMSAMTRS